MLLQQRRSQRSVHKSDIGTVYRAKFDRQWFDAQLYDMLLFGHWLSYRSESQTEQDSDSAKTTKIHTDVVLE